MLEWAVATLTPVPEEAWRRPTDSLDWDCWETLEHIADALFFYATQLVPAPPGVEGEEYPFAYRAKRPDGGPEGLIFALDDGGPSALLRTLNACGGLLVGMLRSAPPTHRARHRWGRSDPAGFAAMGVVETTVHLYDASDALGVEWSPPADACGRALERLFPDAPLDGDPRSELLWRTGRISLDDRPQLEEWRWFGEPRG